VAVVEGPSLVSLLVASVVVVSTPDVDPVVDVSADVAVDSELAPVVSALDDEVAGSDPHPTTTHHVIARRQVRIPGA
jgi:hypothetical protein